jgi:hypothetical protein
VNYRRLNSVTTKDVYHLLRIDESLNQPEGSKRFCTNNLNAEYWQVELDPDDKNKTAFVTLEGLYECKASAILILMHQMCISTNKVSSVMLRSNKFQI